MMDWRGIHMGDDEIYDIDDGTTANMVVSAYIKLRNTIREREQDIKDLKQKQEVLSHKMLEICNKNEMDSFRTPFGTVSRKIRQSYWTSDWEKMYEFIAEHDAPFLLEKRIHTGNMKEFLKEYPEESPIGLQSKSEFYVSVRKPTSTAD
jgi:hypothetical protein